MAMLNGTARHWRPHSSGRCILLCVLIAAPIGSARAQDRAVADLPVEEAKPESPPPQDDKEIFVTGSRLPRANLTAISPVTVVDGREVKLQGAVLTEQLLNSLPQVVADQGAFLSNDATGTATVDLRGLGPGRTLVLVNGRRLLPGDPTYPAPDINAVPSSLIKRVEVLTGGASSVYGSDALAGVVNFILDTRLEGLRIEGQTSVFQHDNRDGQNLGQALERAAIPFPKGNAVDGGSQDINAAYGTSFADGRGHVTAYAGYRKLSAVTESERDYSACATQGRLDSNIFDCGGSEASEAGTFYTRFGGPFQVGPGREFVDGTTLFNFAPLNYYQRSGRRYTVGGFAEFELSRSIRPFFELMYMDDRSLAQVAPSALFFELDNINCDNPLLSEQQREVICFTGNFVGEQFAFDDDGNLAVVGGPEPFIDPVTGTTYFRGVLFAGRRNVEGGPRIQELRHKNLRLLGGFRGELSRSITYEATALFGRVKFKGLGSNDLAISRLARALDIIADPATGQPACRSALTGEDPACVPWDIFAPRAVTPEAADYLSVPTSRSGKVEQAVVTAFSTFELAEWGVRSPWSDEGPSLNLGTEYRNEKLDYRPDARIGSGDIAGADLDAPVSGSTESKELFGEIRIPIVTRRGIESLVAEGGYRLSWQSNSESRFRVSSYKLALEFAPIPDIRFRASLQRAVRAPNVQELFSPVFRGGFGVDLCAGADPIATEAQCASTGVTPQQYGNIVPRPTGIPYNAISGGNPALDPERASTRSIGLVLRPRFIPGLSATVDWFDIKIRGGISQSGPGVIINTCLETDDPLFCDRVHRDPNGSLWQTDEGFVDNRNVNVARLTARGIDVGVNYARSIGRVGSIDLDFLGSGLDTQKTDPGGLASPLECAGAYGSICGVSKPSWRHKARATWSATEQLSISLHWRYYGSVALDRSMPGNLNLIGPWRPGDERIGAQSFFDLTFLARASRGYELRLGIRNILDKEPPIISVTGFNPEGACSEAVCNGNTFPQVYDPLGRYLFAGVTLNFN